MDIEAWLRGLGLEEYTKAFAENGVLLESSQRLRCTGRSGRWIEGQHLLEPSAEAVGIARRERAAIQAPHANLVDKTRHVPTDQLQPR